MVSAECREHKDDEKDARGRSVPLPDHDKDKLRHQCVGDMALPERACSSEVVVSYNAEGRYRKH